MIFAGVQPVYLLSGHAFKDYDLRILLITLLLNFLETVMSVQSNLRKAVYYQGVFRSKGRASR